MWRIASAAILKCVGSLYFAFFELRLGGTLTGLSMCMVVSMLVNLYISIMGVSKQPYSSAQVFCTFYVISDERYVGVVSLSTTERFSSIV